MKNRYEFTISEYGKEIRKYSDSDRERFLREAERILCEHLKTIRTHPDGLKNTNIHIAQFE